MVAAMATVSGPAASLAAITELSGDVGGWLRQYSGYREVFVFVDENERSSRVTLWETAADERAARQARGAMRDELMAMAGLEVVSFEVYEVPGHEYVDVALIDSRLTARSRRIKTAPRPAAHRLSERAERATLVESGEARPRKLAAQGGRVRSRQDADGFQVSAVVERLTPYETAEVPHVPCEERVDPELVERAATLLAVMPRNQLRQTIERLLCPEDLERGRRAVDALIDAAFAIEDETGHLRRAT